MAGSVEITDRTGQPRRSEGYAQARHVVEERLVDFGRTMTDPELSVELTTIRAVLMIAEAIAKKREEYADSVHADSGQ